MREGHTLKNGLPNWDVLDPLIIAARKSGASLADIMATMKLSKKQGIRSAFSPCKYRHDRP